MFTCDCQAFGNCDCPNEYVHDLRANVTWHATNCRGTCKASQPVTLSPFTRRALARQLPPAATPRNEAAL